MPSSSEKHVAKILNMFVELRNQGVDDHSAIREILKHTVKKAYILNILEKEYGVVWTMESRFLSMQKDFRNAFFVDYFTDNLHPCPVCGELTPHISKNCCKECSCRNITSIKKRTIKTAETKKTSHIKLFPLIFKFMGTNIRLLKNMLKKLKRPQKKDTVWRTCFVYQK